MRQIPYPLTIAPAVTGVIAGVLLTTAGIDRAPDSVTYASLPEFHLWRWVIVAQVSIYIGVSTFLWIGRRHANLPRLSLPVSLATAALTFLVVILPQVLVSIETFPLYVQGGRLSIVVLLGMITILLVMDRVARVFVAFGEAEDAERHGVLHRSSRDLLTITGLVVTLATLGSGILQASLAAMARVSATYQAPITSAHVTAYGAYFALLLFLFFTPVFVAERRAAERIASRLPGAPTPELTAQLHLKSSLTEHVGSAFGVLSPLLGALATRLLT